MNRLSYEQNTDGTILETQARAFAIIHAAVGLALLAAITTPVVLALRTVKRIRSKP